MAYVILSFQSNAQSKKEQIVQLNQKSDSLLVVIQREQGKTDSLALIVSNKENQLNLFKDELVIAQKKVLSLESELANESSLRRKEKEELMAVKENSEKKELLLMTKIESSNSNLKIIQEKLNKTNNNFQNCENQLLEISTQKDKTIKDLSNSVFKSSNEINILKEKINAFSNQMINQVAYDDIFLSSIEDKKNTKKRIVSFDFIDEEDEFTIKDGIQIPGPFPKENLTGESPLLNGTLISYWNNITKTKQIFAKGKFKNGLKEGNWNFYLCDGRKQYEGSFKNGQKDGKWINYDFCNSTFVPSKLVKQLDQENHFKGYLFIFNVIGDYYSNVDRIVNSKFSYRGGLAEIFGSLKKEILFFDNGVPTDTIYYADNLNQIKLKIVRKTGHIFYENNQAFINQNYVFNDPMLLPTEKNSLLFYYPNGNIAYKYSKSGISSDESYYYEDGKIKSKVDYKDESFSGTLYTYDKVGKLIGTHESYGPEGKKPKYLNFL